MKTFNVLDRTLDVRRHYMLEASAGTGKTFSIENIVVRLLLEAPAGEEPLTLEQILVVTFTKAATRDLKMRVRSNIQRTLSLLQDCSTDAPDYLLALMDLGQEAVNSAQKRLEDALFGFDRASIFTIHGFCSRMLRELAMAADVVWDCREEKEQLSHMKQMQMIADFFRTGLTSTLVSPRQLQAVIPRGDIEKLFKKLLKILNRGLTVECPLSFQELYVRLHDQMKELKAHYGLNTASILADFERVKPYYNKINAQAEEAVGRFAALFDRDIWSEEDLDIFTRDKLKWCELIDEENRKKNKKGNSEELLRHPGLSAILKKKLGALVDAIGDSGKIIAVIAHACQKLCRRVVEEEELPSFDGLLRKMQEALSRPLFVEEVRKRYKAVIVDEFQDTDPIQWEIFHTLFPVDSPEWQGVMILVGDPKQSIYSFRQADIYTYLRASKALGTDRCLSLDCNFRSQPSMIHALNSLFDTELTPGWISLPRLKSALPYLPVKAGGKTEDRVFKDRHGSVHLMAVEAPKIKVDDACRRFFFPYIAQEIARLHRDDQCSFDQFAVLVANRYEAQGLIEILRLWNIPCVYQTNQNLSKSKAVAAWRELLEAVIRPGDQRLLKIALGGALIGWTHEEILSLEAPHVLEDSILRFMELRRYLQEEGIAGLFRTFSHSVWKQNGVSVEECLLSRRDGQEFHNEYRQVAEWMIDRQGSRFNSADKLIESLYELQEQEEEESSIKKRPANTGGVVRILTIHSSKGLEFDIVFAVGVVNRPSKVDRLIPVEKENGALRLCAVAENDPHYLRFCDEADAEKMRQLYVALTRAKYRLYIPALFGNTASPERGSASAMELFLARFARPEGTMEELYLRIAGLSLEAFCGSVKGDAASYGSSTASIQNITAADFTPIPLVHRETVKLIPPPLPTHVNEPLYIRSFTSLSKGKNVAKAAGFDPPHDFLAINRSAHTLPTGSETGTLLHLLLEMLSFASYRDMKSSCDLLPHVRKRVEGTLYSPWEEVIASILYEVLTKDLGGWCLTGIEEGASYREIEFLFPLDGFCKGVIDLLCYHEGKYYLVDWKSNWLGPTFDCYNQEHMHQAMAEHDYYLQAKLYREALMRYLALVDRRPFEEIYGGMYYLFLRGINPLTADGVLFLKDSDNG